VSEAGSLFFSVISASGLDFRIGTITTDSAALAGSGTFTNDLVTFQGDIDRGTGGSSTESGIWFSEQALEASGSVTSAGYPRANAGMTVIILSDEASQYTANSGGATFDPGNNLFVDNGYTVFAIVAPGTAASSQYDDLAASTNGYTADIGDLSTFPAIMEEVATQAAASASAFRLTHTPISSSIEVRVNGGLIPNSTNNGWRFVRGSIVFYGSAVPAAGATVEVTYDRVIRTTVRRVSGLGGDELATISWDPIPDASQYNVYWATGASPVTPTNGTQVANVFSPYTQTGLSNGTLYRFIVTAIVMGTEGPPSAEVVVSPRQPFAPWGFEAGLDGWTASGGFAVTTENANTGTSSVTESPGGDYANSADATLTSPTYDLSGTSPSITFFHSYETEASYDTCRLEVSTDGGATWTQAGSSFSGSSAGWVEQTIDLSSFAAANFVLRFHFTSDGSAVGDGWYIDDITLAQ